MATKTTEKLMLSERQFQSSIIELAGFTGWKVQHQLPSQIRPGVWKTNVQGDTGFPDLVLAHPTKGVIFAEIKTATGKLADAQRSWLHTLKEAGAEVYVWRPEDWPFIKNRLGRPAR